MKFSKSFINKLGEKENIEKLLYNIDNELGSGILKDFNFRRVNKASDSVPRFYNVKYLTEDGKNQINLLISHNGDFNWCFQGELVDEYNKSHKLDDNFSHYHDFIGNILNLLQKQDKKK